MATTGAAATKPHAVCIPGPFQSHIKSMLKLAKLLHYNGFHITFVNTDFNHRRFLKSNPNSMQDLHNFRFKTIPDPSATQNLLEVMKAITTKFLEPFLELIAKLNHTTSSEVPPVTCIVSDGFLPFTTTAAEELGIPVALFFTISACSFMGFKHFTELKERGLAPLKAEKNLEDGYLDRSIDWIPGMKDIRFRDLPSFPPAANPIAFDLCMEATEKACKASAIILHTFDALEQEILDALVVPPFPRVYAIGPLQLLINQMQQDEEDDGLNSIGYNLWKEETECFHWLDSQEPNSVVYVNSGSTSFLTEEQLIELGMGLVNSNHLFLLILRPDMIRGKLPVLPKGLDQEIKEKGLVSNWCPQEQVLNHPSVGCFLSHCGWGSTIESISSGVPMICWPQAGDQPTNCRYTCNEWRIGMEIDCGLTRDVVERVVRDVLDGESGKNVKSRAVQWKNLAEAACSSPDGSSVRNLDKLVEQLLSCGFQVCLFCYKKMLELDGRCPNCRKIYNCDPVEVETSVHGGNPLTIRLGRSCSLIERS